MKSIGTIIIAISASYVQTATLQDMLKSALNNDSLMVTQQLVNNLPLWVEKKDQFLACTAQRKKSTDDMIGCLDQVVESQWARDLFKSAMVAKECIVEDGGLAPSQCLQPLVADVLVLSGAGEHNAKFEPILAALGDIINEFWECANDPSCEQQVISDALKMISGQMAAYLQVLDGGHTHIKMLLSIIQPTIKEASELHPQDLTHAKLAEIINQQLSKIAAPRSQELVLIQSMLSPKIFNIIKPLLAGNLNLSVIERVLVELFYDIHANDVQTMIAKSHFELK